MKKIQKIFAAFLMLILVLTAILCFQHMDLKYITLWGKSLLEHVFQGNLSDYAVDLYQMDCGTNYNLFQNLNVAFWILPLYLIEAVTKWMIPEIIYQTWIKAVIAVLHFMCAGELYKVVRTLGFDDRKAGISALLYFMSPMVMVHGIGIGQIDCIGIYFFLLSVRFYLEKHYKRMTIAMGLALLSKFFVVFVYIPVFLLHFDQIKKMWKYALYVLFFPVLEKILTACLIRDYEIQSTIHNCDVFFPRLFQVSVNYESMVIFFILIICGICLLISNRGWRKTYQELLVPAVLFFLFLLLVFWHPQWILYILPIILIMGCSIANEWEYAFFYCGFSMGFTLHSLVNCNTAGYNAILVHKSLLGAYLKKETIYIGPWIEAHISRYAGNIGYTIFLASFVLLIVLYLVNVIAKKEEKSVSVGGAVWTVIASAPMICYTAALFLIG